MIPPPALPCLLLLLIPIAAQPTSPPADNSIGNFQPSLGVVIGMLSIMFSLTFILLLYAKFCHRASSAALHHSHQIHDSLIRSHRTTSGLDRSLVNSLPFFPFSSLHGSRHGLECAVCLAKFHDADLLRLLPKCKHAFHLDCIDQWLHKHSTCPLCRHRVSPDDLTASLRFLSGHNELYIHGEDSCHASSRFSLAGSFRKSEDNDIECLPIVDSEEAPADRKTLHKLNHRIVIADVVFKHRWSNVSSADLMVLNSEMLNYVSSARFSSIDCREKEEEKITESEADPVMDIKKEMERKILFESKVREIRQFPGVDRTRITALSESSKAQVTQNDKRSMSEIILHPRFMESRIGCRDSSSSTTSMVKEERRRRIWLPIARKTVQWFANREKTRPSTTTLHTPNV